MSSDSRRVFWMACSILLAGLLWVQASFSQPNGIDTKIYHYTDTDYVSHNMVESAYHIAHALHRKDIGEGWYEAPNYVLVFAENDSLLDRNIHGFFEQYTKTLVLNLRTENGEVSDTWNMIMIVLTHEMAHHVLYEAGIDTPRHHWLMYCEGNPTQDERLYQLFDTQWEREMLITLFCMDYLDGEDY